MMRPFFKKTCLLLLLLSAWMVLGSCKKSQPPLVGLSLWTDIDFWQKVTPEQIRAYLAAGAQVDAIRVNPHFGEGEGFKPIHLAVRYSPYEEAIDILLEAGADANAQTDGALRDGSRPLHIVSLRPAPVPSIVGTLLAAGADIDARNNFDRTPLMYALRSTPIFKKLIEAGANLDLQVRFGDSYEHGFTALHFAANEGRVEATGLLLEAGADLNIKNTLGQEPLCYAIERRNIAGDSQVRRNAEQVIDLLMAKGGVCSTATP